MPIYRIVDLFAGAGGLTRGFVDTGHFESVLGVEIDSDARTSYALNFHNGSMANTFTDVTSLTKDQVPVFDVLVGGPPCQDFTQLARVRQDQTKDRNDLLWNHYISLVHELHPAVFVIENVPNLLVDPDHELHRQSLTEGLQKVGYEIAWGVLNTANYGVPQSRYRAFIIGSRVGKPYLPFPNLQTTCAWEVIRDLEHAPLGEIPKTKKVLTGKGLHIGRKNEILHRLRYKYVLPLGNRLHIPEPITIKSWVGRRSGTTDSFGRINPLQPSPTIRCEAFKPEKGRFLHPYADRPITPAEMARLQTFPDDHKFYGSLASVGRQIGNAVPPAMARQLASVVYNILQGLSTTTVCHKPDELQHKEEVRFRGNTAPQRVLNLLRDNVGKPVPWWRIEAAVRDKADSTFVDWGTPLRVLKEEGYQIMSGPALGVLDGEYQLLQPTPLPVPDRPAVRRLLAHALERETVCRACGDHPGRKAVLVRSPQDGSILNVDNVLVLCDSCQPDDRKVAPTEEAVYRWLAKYRHYPPVAPLLFEVAEIDGKPVSGPAPEENSTLPGSWVSDSCELCGCSDTGVLRPSLIRPRSAGGLLHLDNVWTLCTACAKELKKAVIKIPTPSANPGTKDKGVVVALCQRFRKPGFLTPKEAFYRNWLLVNRKDKTVIERARRALLTGSWQQEFSSN